MGSRHRIYGSDGSQRQQLESFHPHYEKLKLGDGKFIEATGKGKYSFISVTDKTITLHNVLVIPALHYPPFSLEGYTFASNGSVMTGSDKAGNPILRGVKTDKLYRAQLSNLLASELEVQPLLLDHVPKIVYQ